MALGNRINLGRAGEKFAEHLLRKRGYRILERNYKCSLGEIDIIAVDGNTLVFVEVRTRTSFKYGTAGESVTWNKQNKLKKLALYYLMSQKIGFMDCRFDVVSVRALDTGLTADIYKNAFS